MFTKMDKALVSVVMGLLFMLTQFGVEMPGFVNETFVGMIIGIATPLLVYFVPNKVA